MPDPGSKHALVLFPATPGPDDEQPPGERAASLLEPFLDAGRYAALAVVHGRSKSASRAFDLAKRRLVTGRGLVWLPEDELRHVLTGENKADLKRLLAPRDGRVVTFASIARRRVVTGLPWTQLRTGKIDSGFVQAERA